MTLQVVQFEEKHLEDAAALFAQRYRQARELACQAPDYENSSTLLPRLKQLVATVPSVAVLQGGRLAGFLAAYLLEDLHGQRAVYSPEWANAADTDNTRQIYQAMYASLASRWVRNGYLAHYVSVLACDPLVLETLHWMSFGMMGVDAVRDVSPIEAGGAGIDIREATSDEIPDVVGLNQELERYMASAPIFLPLTKKCDARYYQEWLADSNSRLWLAYHDDEAVGYIKLQKWDPDVCLVTQDDRSVSIVGAFTKERFRGRGVGTALLSQVLSWARSMGFERCAVDLATESTRHSLLAAVFWTCVLFCRLPRESADLLGTLGSQCARYVVKRIAKLFWCYNYS